MADDFDDGIDEAFKGFGEEPGTQVTPPVNPDEPTPPAPAAVEPPKPKEGEEDANKNQPPNPAEGTPKPGDPQPPAPEGNQPPNPEEKPGEGKPAEPPTPPAEPESRPLTEEGLRAIISEVRSEERTSGQALESATKDVLDAYYPDGLSNILVDQASGKELRTPQDVIDASGGELTMDQATQWLMNEQYKLDSEINKIRSDAKNIAETTLKFKQDGEAVLRRYDPIFKAYPQLQSKVWTQFSKLVKADEKKGVILSAPDMAEFYDTVLEPYRLAYEYSTKNPGTNPTPPPATPPAPTPSAGDRLDESGDGGVSEPDDPNNFAQQVSKELAKGL